MRLLFADAETYWDTDYTLRKMTPAEYILDPRFELLGVSIAWDAEPATWVDGPDFKAWVAAQDMSDVAVVSHNALFDACLFDWHFGMKPKLWVDTMSMARAFLRHKTRRIGLAACAKVLHMPAKGNTTADFRGYRFRELRNNEPLYRATIDYANHDNDLCRGVFLSLMGDMPAEEWAVMDMIIRAAVEPQLMLDPGLLNVHLQEVQQQKADLLQRVTADKSVLMSNDKFALALMELGIDPPRKISLKTGKETWAFAKTDPGMGELEEHDDEHVQALVAARLGIKSTQEETRTERFIKLSRLDWGDGQPWMPVPLKYSAALTHRLGGEWALNLQNLKRGGNLRRALKAPPGHKVMTVDAAQIEARVNGYEAGEAALMHAFARREDVYSLFASTVFDRPITKADKPERFLGKTSILGLGYGMGGIKFQATVALQARLQMKMKMELSTSEAYRVVKLYRETYPRIAEHWNIGETVLAMMTQKEADGSWGNVQVRHECLILPNGLKLRYEGLRREKVAGPNGAEWKWYYNFEGQKNMIYGAKLVENKTQALSRVHITQAALNIKRMTGRDFAMQVHDELVYVVPDEEVDAFGKVLYDVMVSPPGWACGLPLDAEVGKGDNYGDAK